MDYPYIRILYIMIEGDSKPNAAAKAGIEGLRKRWWIGENTEREWSLPRRANLSR